MSYTEVKCDASGCHRTEKTESQGTLPRGWFYCGRRRRFHACSEKCADLIVAENAKRYGKGMHW